MKRIFALYFVAVLVFGFSSTVYASSDADLDQLLRNACVSGEETDISQFSLTESKLTDRVDKLYQTGQFPWYVSLSFEYTADDKGKILSVNMKSAQEQGFDLDQYEQKIAELMHETCLPGMPAWVKVLSVHDHMATMISYDQTQKQNDAFEALINHSSACEGYARLFMDVMNRQGIPCQIAVCDDAGNGIGHAWNMVQLENSWYHVDVTWDDPVPDIYGRSMHTHFLKNDGQYNTAENGHNHDWKAYVSCKGGKYDHGMPWDNVDSPFAFDDNAIAYYLKVDSGVSTVYKLDQDGMTGTKLYASEEVSLDLGEGLAYYPVMGLSFWNGRLYFNSPKQLISIGTDGTGASVEFEIDVSGEKKFLLGSHISNGEARLTVADGDFDQEERSVSVGDAGHIHNYVKGERIEATCSKSGGVLVSCECGVSFITDMTGTLDHDFETVNSGEDSDVKRFTCKNCGYTYEDSKLYEVKGTDRMKWVWVGGGILLLIIIAVVIKKKNS